MQQCNICQACNRHDHQKKRPPAKVKDGFKHIYIYNDNKKQKHASRRKKNNHGTHRQRPGQDLNLFAQGIEEHHISSHEHHELKKKLAHTYIRLHAKASRHCGQYIPEYFTRTVTASKQRALRLVKTFENMRFYDGLPE